MPDGIASLLDSGRLKRADGALHGTGRSVLIIRPSLWRALDGGFAVERGWPCRRIHPLAPFGGDFPC
jgi:hypothetical protein